MESWYVVHTHPRGEPLAIINLNNQGLETYLPRQLKRRRHARRTEWVPAPLFPAICSSDSIWTGRAGGPFIRPSESATWCANGELPAPVPHGIVEDIRSCEDDDGVVIVSKQAPFDKGERVQIMTGALRDQVGLFDCATDDERIFILLDLLGRQVRVRVPLETVSVYV